jgi:hypothetical protein
MKKYVITVVTVALGLAALTGCGPSTAHTTAQNTAKAAAPSPSRRSIAVDGNGFPTDGCALISKDLVASTLSVTIATVKPTLGGCEYDTDDFSSGGGSYDFNIYPVATTGTQPYDDLAGSTGNPGFRKVPGPWTEAVYFKEWGGALTFAYKDATWIVSTEIGGSKLTSKPDPDNLLPQLTKLAAALSAALAA